MIWLEIVKWYIWLLMYEPACTFVKFFNWKEFFSSLLPFYSLDRFICTTWNKMWIGYNLEEHRKSKLKEPFSICIIFRIMEFWYQQKLAFSDYSYKNYNRYMLCCNHNVGTLECMLIIWQTLNWRKKQIQ